MDGRIPSWSIAFGGILFEDDKVGHGLDSNQADLRMECFIFAESYFAMRHFLGQPRSFILPELIDRFFDVGCDLLLSTVGCRHESIQLAKLKQPADVSNTAVVGLPYNKMHRTQEAM